MAKLKFTAWNNDDPENKKPRESTCDSDDVAGIDDEGDFRRVLISRNGGSHSLKVRETVEQIEKAAAKK